MQATHPRQKQCCPACSRASPQLGTTAKWVWCLTLHSCNLPSLASLVPDGLLTRAADNRHTGVNNAQVVLDDMLLELLPPLAVLADRSADCSRLLTAFCSLAAAACSPRDLITACLEVLSNLVETSRCATSNASFLPMRNNLNRHPKPQRAQQALVQHTLRPLCAATGLYVQSWARWAAVCMQPAAHAPRASCEAQPAQGSQCCGVLLGCRRTCRGVCLLCAWFWGGRCWPSPCHVVRVLLLMTHVCSDANSTRCGQAGA